MRPSFAALVVAAALALPAVPAAAESGDVDAGWGFLGRVGVDRLSGDPVTPKGGDHTLAPVSCGDACGTLVMLDADGRQVQTFAPTGTVPFVIRRLVEVPSGVLALGAGVARYSTAGQVDTTFTVAPEAGHTWLDAAQGSAGGPIHLGGYRTEGHICGAEGAVVRTVSATGATAATQPRLPDVAQYEQVPDLDVGADGTLYVGFAATTVVSGVRCTGDTFRFRGFVLAYGPDSTARSGFGFNGVVVLYDRTGAEPGGLGLTIAPAGLVTASERQLRVLQPATGATIRTFPVGMQARNLFVDDLGRYVVGGDRTAWIRANGDPDLGVGTCGYSAVAGWFGSIGTPVRHRGAGVLVRQGDVLLRLDGDGGAAAPHRTGRGAWTVQADGRVHTVGDGLWCGPGGALSLGAPIVGIALQASRNGYWIAAGNGAVRAFGHAPHRGDLTGRRLNRPIVGIAATPTGNGYWLVASDGGIFSFGDARFLGSTGAMRLNRPIVGMAASPTGRGYWLVASDGGIFTFGDARFHGSTGNLRLASPIVGMAATSTGGGYHLLASAGGTFAFGDAVIVGNAGCRAVDVDGLPDRRARVFCADGRIVSPSFQVPAAGRPIVAGVGG